ncbi:hypothetical protein ACJQWK_01147 [Exserohilum turcicum]
MCVNASKKLYPLTRQSLLLETDKEILFSLAYLNVIACSAAATIPSTVSPANSTPTIAISPHHHIQPPQTRKKERFPTPGIEPGPCRHLVISELSLEMRAANPSH